MVIAGLIGVTVYLVDGDRFNLAGSTNNGEVRVEVTSRTSSTAASEDGARMFNGGAGGNGLDYQGRLDRYSIKAVVRRAKGRLKDR